MIDWRLGTMGYAYRDWNGPFYPPRATTDRWLPLYAQQFSAVEMNTTFHAVPTIERAQSWTQHVPPSFRFSMKAPRAITHDHPLEFSTPVVAAFINAAIAMRPMCGPLLFQFGPQFDVANFSRLTDFLAAWPTTLPLAIEFRHSSWRRDSTHELLRQHDAALVALDHEDHPAWTEVWPTSRRLYVRLVGKHGRYPTEDYERFDPTPQLEQWQAKIAAADLSAVTEIWVMFNNDFAGHAPATLRRFAKLIGHPLPNPPAVQKRLF